MNRCKMGLFVTALALLASAPAAPSPPEGRERVGVRGEVIARVRSLSESGRVRLLSFGKSELGRAIPAFIITDFTQSAEEKHRILVIAGQHGDEPNPIRAVLSLSEELARGEHTAILSGCVLIVIPLVNPDGAEKHTRVNARGVDLNRNWPALSSAETRFVNGIIRVWKPEFLIDAHEWTASGPMRPNSVEMPYAGTGSRTDVLSTLAHSIASASGLARVHSGQNSNGRLFHRRYYALGYGTCLLETSANRSFDSKLAAYKSAILAASSALLNKPGLGACLSPASQSFDMAAVGPYLDPLPRPTQPSSAWPVMAGLLGAYCLMLWVLREPVRSGQAVWSRRFRRCLIEADVPLNSLASRRTIQPITSRSWVNRRLRTRYLGG